MNTQVVLFLGDELEASYYACIYHSEHYNAHYDGLRHYHLTEASGDISFNDPVLDNSNSASVSKKMDLIYQDINKVSLVKKSEDRDINFLLICPPIINSSTLDFLKMITGGLDELYLLKGYIMRITLVVPTLNIIPNDDVSASDFDLKTLKSEELRSNPALKERYIQQFGIQSIKDQMSKFSIIRKIIILDNQNQNGKGLNLSLEDLGIVISNFTELLYRRQNEVLNSWNTDYMSFGLSTIYYDLPQIMELLSLELSVQEKIKNNYCIEEVDYEKIMPAVDKLNTSFIECLSELEKQLPTPFNKLKCEDLFSCFLKDLKKTRYNNYFSFVDDPNFTLVEKIHILSLWANLRAPEPGYSDYPSLLSLLYPIVTDAYIRMNHKCDANENSNNEEVSEVLNTSGHDVIPYEEIDNFMLSLTQPTSVDIEIPSFDKILLRDTEALSLWNGMVHDVAKSDFESSMVNAMEKQFTQINKYYTQISKYLDKEYNQTWFPWLKRFFKRGDYTYNQNYLEELGAVKNNLLVKEESVHVVKYKLDLIEVIRSLVIDELNRLTNFKDNLRNEQSTAKEEINTILHTEQNPLFISIVPLKEAHKVIKRIVQDSLKEQGNFDFSTFSDLTLFRAKRAAYFKSIMDKEAIFRELKSVDVSTAILNYLLGRTRDSELLGRITTKNPDWLSDYLSDTKDYAIELMFKENISPFVFMNQVDKSENLQKTYGLLIDGIEDLTIRLAVKKSLDELVNTSSELYDSVDPYKVVSFSFGKINNLEDCTF